MNDPVCTQSDELLCMLAASGDCIAEETLVMRYNRLVRICARPFFLAGGDSEDLLQEGMLGLLTAVREFDVQREVQFRTYAEVCIRRRLLSAIRAAGRDKHNPLNYSLSLEINGTADSVDCWKQQSPEELLIDREVLRERMDRLYGELSKLESLILGHYLNGLSYLEIAREIDRPQKSVDNAVQRIRRKLAQHLSFGDFSES